MKHQNKIYQFGREGKELFLEERQVFLAGGAHEARAPSTPEDKPESVEKREKEKAYKKEAENHKEKLEELKEKANGCENGINRRFKPNVDMTDISAVSQAIFDITEYRVGKKIPPETTNSNPLSPSAPEYSENSLHSEKSFLEVVKEALLLKKEHNSFVDSKNKTPDALKTLIGYKVGKIQRLKAKLTENKENKEKKKGKENDIKEKQAIEARYDRVQVGIQGKINLVKAEKAGLTKAKKINGAEHSGLNAYMKLKAEVEIALRGDKEKLADMLEKSEALDETLKPYGTTTPELAEAYFVNGLGNSEFSINTWFKSDGTFNKANFKASLREMGLMTPKERKTGELVVLNVELSRLNVELEELKKGADGNIDTSDLTNLETQKTKLKTRLAQIQDSEKMQGLQVQLKSNEKARDEIVVKVKEKIKTALSEVGAEQPWWKLGIADDSTRNSNQEAGDAMGNLMYSIDDAVKNASNAQPVNQNAISLAIQNTINAKVNAGVVRNSVISTIKTIGFSAIDEASSNAEKIKAEMSNLITPTVSGIKGIEAKITKTKEQITLQESIKNKTQEINTKTQEINTKTTEAETAKEDLDSPSEEDAKHLMSLIGIKRNAKSVSNAQIEGMEGFVDKEGGAEKVFNNYVDRIKDGDMTAIGLAIAAFILFPKKKTTFLAAGLGLYFLHDQAKKEGFNAFDALNLSSLKDVVSNTASSAQLRELEMRRENTELPFDLNELEENALDSKLSPLIFASMERVKVKNLTAWQNEVMNLRKSGKTEEEIYLNNKMPSGMEDSFEEVNTEKLTPVELAKIAFGLLSVTFKNRAEKEGKGQSISEGRKFFNEQYADKALGEALDSTVDPAFFEISRTQKNTMQAMIMKTMIDTWAAKGIISKKVFGIEVSSFENLDEKAIFTLNKFYLFIENGFKDTLFPLLKQAKEKGMKILDIGIVNGKAGIRLLETSSGVEISIANAEKAGTFLISAPFAAAAGTVRFVKGDLWLAVSKFAKDVKNWSGNKIEKITWNTPEHNEMVPINSGEDIFNAIKKLGLEDSIERAYDLAVNPKSKEHTQLRNLCNAIWEKDNGKFLAKILENSLTDGMKENPWKYEDANGKETAGEMIDLNINGGLKLPRKLIPQLFVLNIPGTKEVESLTSMVINKGSKLIGKGVQVLSDPASLWFFDSIKNPIWKAGEESKITGEISAASKFFNMGNFGQFLIDDGEVLGKSVMKLGIVPRDGLSDAMTERRKLNVKLGREKKALTDEINNLEKSVDAYKATRSKEKGIAIDKKLRSGILELQKEFTKTQMEINKQIEETEKRIEKIKKRETKASAEGQRIEKSLEIWQNSEIMEIANGVLKADTDQSRKAGHAYEVFFNLLDAAPGAVLSENDAENTTELIKKRLKAKLEQYTDEEVMKNIPEGFFEGDGKDGSGSFVKWSKEKLKKIKNFIESPTATIAKWIF